MLNTNPHTDIINLIIQKRNYKTYLEIGIFDSANFNSINIDYKIGVDPDINTTATYLLTSDEYFASCRDKFDIIFIDGLHEKNQVVKDIENSLKILNEGGLILVHDCLPPNFWSARLLDHKYTAEDGLLWLGDVWEGWVELRTRRTDIKMEIIDIGVKFYDDWGLGIVQPGSQKLIQFNFDLPYEEKFKIWFENKKQLSNVIEIGDFLQKYIY